MPGEYGEDEYGAFTYGQKTPAPPQNLASTVENGDDIALTWDAVGTADSYNLYRATASGTTVGDYTLVAEPSSTNYTDTALLDGERYYYRVTAENTQGESGVSNETASTTVLPAPSALTATTPATIRELDLSWQDNSDNEDGFRVLEKRSSASTYTPVADLPAGTTTYTATSLLDGEEYDVKIEAYTEHTTSESSVATATTLLPDEDQPVLGNGVEDEISVDRESAVSNYGDVRIQLRETGGTAWDGTEPSFQEFIGAYDTLQMEFVGLEDGEEYEVRARTETEHVTGAWTTPVSIVTVFPGATNLSLTAVDESQIDATWVDNADNEDGFRVFVAEELDPRADTGFGPYEEVADLAPNTTTYSITNLKANHDYQVFIQAYTEHTTADSGTVSATTPIDPSLSQSLVLTNPADTVQLGPDEIVAKDLQKTHTGIGTARVEVPEVQVIQEYTQRQDRVNYYVNGSCVFTGYAVGYSGDDRTGRWTLRVDGIGKRLEETRPDYESLGGSLTYSNQALDEVLKDYWPRTPFSVSVTDQVPELVAENELIQSADTTSEWQNVSTLPDTTPIVISSGEFAVAQTSFTTEGEDAGVQSGTTFLQEERYSGSGTNAGTGVALEFDGGGQIAEWTFTPQYRIPESAVSIWTRFEADNAPRIEATLNGSTWQAFPSGAGFNPLSPQWVDLADPDSGPVDGGYAGGDLLPGQTYTVRFESASNPGGSAYVDVIAPLDNRYSYTFDNTLDTSGDGSRVLSGPEFFPDAVTIELDLVGTAYNIPESTLSVVIDDTSNGQALAVSNDGGATYTSAANTSTLTHQYAGAGRQARVRFTLSRYGSQANATPTTGINGQSIDSFTHRVDLNDLTVIDELELSRNHFDNLKKLHNYGSFQYTIEHDDSALGDLTVNSYPKGAITRATPEAFQNPENRSPEVAAETYFNSVFLQGQLREDGTRPTAEVSDQTAINNDGREISPGVLRDPSISTEAGASFRANALLERALSNNDLRGSISTYPVYVSPGYDYSVAFSDTAQEKTLESVSIRESAGSISASYDFVVREALAETLNSLRQNERDVSDQV